MPRITTNIALKKEKEKNGMEADGIVFLWTACIKHQGQPAKVSPDNRYYNVVQ
jgi:hypothetical protein